MNTSRIFKEAKRLHRLGFAVHWLHPNSKRPVESGWTTGPRKTWDYLKETYAETLNVGVRLGSPSKIDERGFLAVVDVDVKSKDDRHRKEAVRAAKKLLGGAPCPVALSGRGNGSRHYYCVTKEPFKTFNPAQSEEMIKVYMPSKKPSKKELEELTEKEIADGMRISRAWEISLYSDGRQVVLPPSIHPDSNKPYTWAANITDIESLPLVDFSGAKPEKTESAKAPERGGLEVEEDFEIVPVELDWLDVSDRIKKGIKTGEGVDDRSAFLLPACVALHSAGLSKNEILTVLTEPDTFLGACAYDHAKTTSRRRAAHWLWKYTLRKVLEERSAELAFSKAAKIEPIKKLSEEEAKAQSEEIEGEIDWRDSIEKTEKGKYRNTFFNCITIIMNVCEKPEVVGRNEFSANDYYLCNTPWRSKKGDAVTDIDLIRIKSFCANRFGVEFSTNTINEALVQISDANRYHPVRNWLKALKWDGTERVNTWLKDYGGAVGPEPYLSDVSRKMLVAMVKRVFEPGCKFDHVIILEGNQGTGKSTMLEKLAGEWFSDAPLNIGDKDAILTMQSKWLIELGELSSMSKADLEIFKAFVSQRTDRIRAPYGKRMEEFPRQSIFVGSTNLDEYLKDLTGNRRFWSIALKAEKIDFDGVGLVREQLFAEAMNYYLLGEPLYLENEESAAHAIHEQAKRLQSDEWISTVSDIVYSESFPLKAFEIKDVAKRMDQVGAHRLSPTDVHRITRCLKLLGAESWRESVGARRRLWALKTPSPLVHRRPSPSNESLDGNSSMDTDFY